MIAGQHGPASFRLSKIHHVWIIELENTTFSQSFGRPSADPELAKVLVSKGALLLRLPEVRPQCGHPAHRASPVLDIFHLPPLGDAKQPQVRAFGKDVFTG